jgi:two-component system response regulator HydG
MELLTAYDWPGNVRELENAVERALVVTRDSRLDVPAFGFLQPSDKPAGMTLEDIERAHIAKVWRMCDGNHSKAARILDIDRTTLYNKLRKYGLKE